MRNKEELYEQNKVVCWAREKGILLSSLNQATFTNSWTVLRDNKLAGTVRGVPDLLLVLPAKYRLNKKKKVLFIEMKRVKGGYTSKEQVQWIEALNMADGVSAKVCRGHNDAISYIASFIETEPEGPVTTEAEREDFINNL